MPGGQIAAIVLSILGAIALRALIKWQFRRWLRRLEANRPTERDIDLGLRGSLAFSWGLALVLRTSLAPLRVGWLAGTHLRERLEQIRVAQLGASVVDTPIDEQPEGRR